MGIIRAICLSPEKGTAKQDQFQAELIAQHGLKTDAHAGDWDRQVSLLSFQKIEDFRAKGAEVEYGAFGENLVVDGIDLSSLAIGTRLCCAKAVLEITQIGKECHNHCAIFKRMGDCIMPREGVFAKVLQGGFIKTGDEINIIKTYRAAIITVSDKSSKGEREDASGELAKQILEAQGYYVKVYMIIPDEQVIIENEMKKICDQGLADLILTTGGTGFSARDLTPEATIAVSERLVPGIPEAMRMHSMAITKRAMLSRAAAAIRGKTLIVNLPGSPKSVRENLSYIIPELEHGLDVLTGSDIDCGNLK